MTNTGAQRASSLARQHRARRLVGLLVALGMASGCASDPAPSPWPARWHVARGFLRDAQGRAVIMRGANLSGEHKQKPYFGFHTAADFSRLRRDWGMNSIRFLLNWAALQPASDRFDAQYLEEVARRMDWAKDAGLLVVLDMHQDLFGEGFGGDGAPRWACDEAKYAAYQPVSPWFLNYLSAPVIACFDHLWSDAETGRKFAEAWRQVAARLAGHPAVVGFDVFNEPSPGSLEPSQFETERLLPFYEEVVTAVRSTAPSWVAFLEPCFTRNLGVPTALRHLSVSDVVYAPHSYDPQAEQGLGFDQAHRKMLLTDIANLATEAKRLEAALWIGEYGGIAEDPGIGPYMDAQYDGAAAAGASSMYWDYSRGDGYGLVKSDGAEKTALLAALVRPYPERVAGDAIDFEYDETSRRFTVRYQPVAEIRAPTELAVPDRVYPQGYQVECQGCRFEKEPGRLHIVTPPAGPAASIVLRP